MSSRNALNVFDPELARKQTQAELRERAAPKKVHEANKLSGKAPELSDEVKQRLASALAKEVENARIREVPRLWTRGNPLDQRSSILLKRGRARGRWSAGGATQRSAPTRSTLTAQK